MSPQWTRSTKYIVLAIIFGGLLGFVYFARPLIGPLVISALLAYVLNPLVALITQRTRMRRKLAVLVVYSLTLLVLVAIPTSFFPTLVRQIGRFSDAMLTAETRFENFLNQPLVLGNLVLLPPSQFIENLDQVLRDSIRQASSGAINLLGSVTTNLVWVLIVLVTTYYLLQDGGRLRDWFVRLAPPAYQQDFQRLLAQIDNVWHAFLRGQIILVFVIGVLTGISTAAVGVRGAFALGVLAGILDVIPSLGPLVAGLIAVVVAFVFGSNFIPISNFWFGAIVAGIFLLIQQIENIWLRPQIMGHSLRLHPALVFIGVLGSLALVGVLGALVILPLMASIGILGRYVRAKLYEQDPWEDPQEETDPPDADPENP